MKLALLAGSSLLALSTTFALAGQVFTETTPGTYSYTTPIAGTYDIYAGGAQGGDNIYYSGGAGAEIGGAVTLAAGETLDIVVGAAAGFAYGAGGGGGGGSFVSALGSPLVVAGGGGGPAGYNGSGYAGGPGVTGTAGHNGYGANGGGGLGGTSGGNGANGTGGFYQYQPGSGGLGFSNGATGGASGGYGGGGGGGGYSGGGGGAGRFYGTRGGGGGGGSYLTPDALLLVSSSGANYGNGYVTIDAVSDAVPEPATLALLGAGLGGLIAARRRKSAI